MKLTKKISLVFCIISVSFLNSCFFSQSEDDKIKDVLIGKTYEDDFVDDEGSSIKNIRGEYFDNGKFSSEMTLEIFDDETFETTDLTLELCGEWSVKNKFIYYTYDFDKLKITPELFGLFLKDEMIKSLKETNTPLKVIEYDASKIIYEDSDGERHTLKKSY
jgi:hypothetical protein